MDTKLPKKAQGVLQSHFQTPIQITDTTQLSEPNRRNAIFRLKLAKTHDRVPETIILKKTAIEERGESEQEQMSRFARDWAGIEFLTTIGTHHAPYFYGGDVEDKFILIEDLGEPHHSLVGPLTRAATPANAEEAIKALEMYSHRVGRLQADTHGKMTQFEKILFGIYTNALRLHQVVEKDITDVTTCFKQNANQSSTALAREVEEIQTTMADKDFSVLLHGDICPDNVYYHGTHMQLIDFEYGDVGHALVDGVYPRMSMPTCWCSKTLPESVLTRVESIYWQETRTTLFDDDEDLYQKLKAYACAYWIIRATNWHVKELMEKDLNCDTGPLDSDSVWDPAKNGFRQRVLSRLKAFITLTDRTPYLPAFRIASSTLLKNLRDKWPETRFMDHYPVFTE